MHKIKEKEWNHQSKKLRIIKEKEEKRANKNEEFFLRQAILILYLLFS